MNREKEDQLPMMQVGFIDSICLPIYQVGLNYQFFYSILFIEFLNFNNNNNICIYNLSEFCVI